MATLVQAVRMALYYGETHLGVTDIFGEDVGPPLGGVFTATQGLKTAWNSPLDERGIIGTAMGIAYAGGRPVAEIQFCDYGFNTIDLLKVAGNQRWAGAGNYPMPIVLMTPSGSGIRGSLYHSHSFESWASRLAGWKIVMPSNALDAYGLMLSAIADPNPVLVLLPKALLRVRGEQLLPGEPPDSETLKRMIDAPVGDRSGWKPRSPARRWPALPKRPPRPTSTSSSIRPTQSFPPTFANPSSPSPSKVNSSLKTPTTNQRRIRWCETMNADARRHAATTELMKRNNRCCQATTVGTLRTRGRGAGWLTLFCSWTIAERRLRSCRVAFDC